VPAVLSETVSEKNKNLKIELEKTQMKKLIIIYAAIAVILTVGSIALADITSNLNYVPSSSLTLGANVSGRGYIVPQEFQFNLLYQSGIPDSAIDNFNNFGVTLGSGGHLNFPDYVTNSPAAYYLKISSTGGLPIGIWDYTDANPLTAQHFAPDSGESWVQWTLSYYEQTNNDFYQTILAGDIVDNSFLRVSPTAGYRTFLWDNLAANGVEVFNGATLNSEVLGYSFTSPIGENSVLTPTLVPEPATIGLLGFGALGLIRRKRSA
jgi:hypothetical protein